MKLLTNAELALLALIAERPRHGYEIEQVIEERGMREWTEIGFSSIYYILKKLERVGLIAGQVEIAERRVARTIYQLTSAGREAIHASIVDVLSRPRPCYSPLLLGLANLPLLSLAEAHAALQQYHANLAAQLQHIQGRRERHQPHPSFVDALFDHSITMIQAELNWIAHFLAQLHADEGGN